MFRDLALYLFCLAAIGALIFGQVAAFNGMFDQPEYEMVEVTGVSR